MTSKVPDFNNDELILIRATLRERFGREIALQMADTELRLNLASTEITSCPTAYWEVDNCHYLDQQDRQVAFSCDLLLPAVSAIRHAKKTL